MDVTSLARWLAANQQAPVRRPAGYRTGRGSPDARARAASKGVEFYNEFLRPGTATIFGSAGSTHRGGRWRTELQYPARHVFPGGVVFASGCRQVLRVTLARTLYFGDGHGRPCSRLRWDVGSSVAASIWRGHPAEAAVRRNILHQQGPWKCSRSPRTLTRVTVSLARSVCGRRGLAAAAPGEPRLPGPPYRARLADASCRACKVRADLHLGVRPDQSIQPTHFVGRHPEPTSGRGAGGTGGLRRCGHNTAAAARCLRRRRCSGADATGTNS